MSVVIATHDSASTIGEQLDALAAQEFEGAWEVIVVDDRSTDGTVELVARWADRLPSLTLITLDESCGKSHALNIGTRSTRAGMIAYCDADDVVSPEWLSGIVATLSDHELATGPIDLALLNAPETYRWRGTETWRQLPDWHHFLPTALGCNLGVRHDVFDRLDGFDRSVPISGDFDFEWRAQLDGATLGFAPGAVVHYRLRTKPLAHFRAHVGYGRDEPCLFNRFAAHGMPRRLGPGLLRTSLVVLACPLMLLHNQRYRWLAAAGVVVGRILGSYRHRVLYI